MQHSHDSSDDRPDPDALLARVKAEETKAARARLKIFFGASPGVGKTYTMLEEARRAKFNGEDIVIGIVETHKRPETEKLVVDLDVLPRRTIEHRGVTLTELDLDAALARKPACILVDELAHTNAPGSKHVKRWQDVLELLDAGIDVHTTLNVQHVESLGDVVQQITGVKIRETVPDSVLDRADEIELVDVSAEELLERLADGKVYVPETAKRAADNFFSRGNLMSLRELALRRTAERVDADVVAYRKQQGITTVWSAAERILVAVGPSPGSERLIRATKRIAESLHAEWSAAHVELLGAPPVSDKDRERIENHLRLAASLGATILRLGGMSVAKALLDHARAHNVTRIVAGKPTHARWRDRIRGSLLDDLIRSSGEIEIHVIAPVESAPTRRSVPPPPEERTSVAAYVSAVIAVTAVTSIGVLVQDYIELADMSMLYLLAIASVALLGRGPSLLAASLSVVTFDFMFVPPRFTLAVSDARHLFTFMMMFGVGLAISTLTLRVRRQERDAILRERNTAALLAFTRDIADATTPGDIAAVTVKHLEETFPVAAAVLVPDTDGQLSSAAGLMPLANQEQAVARWAYDHAEVAGLGTDTLPGARVLALPLGPAGVIVVQGRQDPRRLGGSSLPVLEAFARQAGLALARVNLQDAARDAALRAHTEELRSSLLSAVSHDLRTPLAVITGAATTLRDDGARLTPVAREELLSSIVEDARRLERVLANLLQLTRVESGMQPNREPIPVEELIGAALTRLEDAIGDRAVKTDIPADIIISVDPVLFEQVLINLLDNALKHGAPPFEIGAAKSAANVEITIRDHGAGIPEAALPKLFDKFVRASTAPGAGLGLAVVRAIVEAHGGRVHVELPADGGARFRIVLPVTT
ncbi:MAG TPA: sensor histidine kinase KdpD [Kofleriaceae bacterium]|jgi:two-component system sensor histidine kinase KdpD